MLRIQMSPPCPKINADDVSPKKSGFCEILAFDMHHKSTGIHLLENGQWISFFQGARGGVDNLFPV